MKRNVYQLGDATYAFSPGSFDALLGHGSVGASKMRELSHAVNVSVSSIKDWRSGAHAPSDIEKVGDVARWLGVETNELLIKMGDESMEERLTERQLDVLCDLWAQAFDFLELAKETDYFVWSDYDLDRIPPSLHRDAVVIEDASVDGEPNSILSLGLHEQVLNAYSRSLRRAYPVVGNTGAYVCLREFRDSIVDGMCYDETGEWLPDPDMLYDPHSEGYVAPMVAKASEGCRLLDELGEQLLAYRERLIQA